jgi:ETFB lysine methyltransferase
MLHVPAVSFTMRYRDLEYGFVRPKDPESILDSMTDDEYEKDKLLPYWAEQWPASFALFNFVAARSRTVFGPGCIVCELGSGLGIVSSVLASRNIRCVATDIAFDACRFSRHNMLLHSHRAAVVCADWRTLCFKPVFNCVIASDIIYEQRWIEPVIRFLQNALAEEGTAYIADPCRQWWNNFAHAAGSMGFNCKQEWQEYVNGGKTKVEILCLRRRRG